MTFFFDKILINVIIMLLIGINIQKRDKKINELLSGVPQMPNMQPKGGMNVDDLVKRIDAKIAELEAEEAAEKEKPNVKSK